MLAGQGESSPCLMDPQTWTISGSKKPASGVQQDSVSGNFLQSLVAVLVGNGLYFALMSHLPVLAQHHIKRLDWGLVVDFWMCLVIYGFLEIAKRWRAGHRDPTPK